MRRRTTRNDPVRTRSRSRLHSDNEEDPEEDKHMKQDTNVIKDDNVDVQNKKTIRLWGRKRVAFVAGIVLGAAVIAAVLVHLHRWQRLQDIDYFNTILAMRDNLTASFSSSSTTSTTDQDRIVLDPNARAHFPVYLVPGVVSTCLESWVRHDSSCASSYFRKRIWGDLSMASWLLLDKQCWLKHVMLDFHSGLDMAGAKTRPSQGLEAVDFLFPGFWIWARIIDNLANIGYDSNTIRVAAYDWRLSFEKMEERDHFFSRLKADIELTRRLQNRKVVVVTHSMGGTLFHYFMKWVESPLLNHTPGWVDHHIEATVNIATPWLGVPKSVPSLLSGEMRDTAHLGWLSASLLERFFTRAERATLFRSWPGPASLAPKGGEVIWGDENGAPDDDEFVQGDNNRTFGTMIALRSDDGSKVRNFTASSWFELLFNNTGSYMKKRMTHDYSHGIVMEHLLLPRYQQPKYWTNPLESQLPNAPNMKIFCLYGIGKMTERSFFYSSTPDTRTVSFDDHILSPHHRSHNESAFDNVNVTQTDNSTAEFFRPYQDYFHSHIDRINGLHLDLEVTNDQAHLFSGVQDSDGDGTVPLISLGFMCSRAWRHSEFAQFYNPSNITTVCREYRHDPTSLVSDVRGGPRTADHTDILGNYDVTRDVLMVAANLGHELSDQIYSNIDQVAKKVRLRETEG